MRKGTLWMVLLLLVGLTSPVAAQPGVNCLQAVGQPYESGDQVCWQVKNVCNLAVGVHWDVRTRNFGIQGARNSPDQTGDIAIAPGATHTVCAKKPAVAGKYCFFFLIDNVDLTKPGDRIHEWLNDIKVAMAAGGSATGQLDIGGFGDLAADVFLVNESANAEGWDFQLGAGYLSKADLPAEVTYKIGAPEDAAEGDEAVFVVAAYDAETGERIGDATIRGRIGAEEAGFEKAAVAASSPIESEPGSPEPAAETPVNPQLSWFEEYSGKGLDQPIVGSTVIFVTNAAEDWVADTHKFSVKLEILAPTGETQTAESHQRPGHPGVFLAEWDTTELPAGEYLLRATMFDGNGGQGLEERWVRVIKAPVASIDGFLIGNVLTVDASGSFDADGEITDYRWTFGDGSTQSGETVSLDIPDGVNTVPIDLTVIDDDGNETTAYCQADVETQEVDCEARSCGCESMDINVDPAAMPWTPIPMHPRGSTVNHLGPVNEVPQPMTPGIYDIRLAFQVEAKLKAGSDPTLCDYYQWDQGTMNDGTGPEDFTNHDGTPGTFPYGGDSYTDDTPFPSNVSATGGGSPSIRWIDAPGFTLGSRNIQASGAGGITWDSAYIVMVTGSEGTCQCSFEVHIKMTATGAPTGPSLTKKVCN